MSNSIVGNNGQPQEFFTWYETEIDDDIIAIVLDRGSAIGFNRRVYFDLLYKSEKDTQFFGKRNATFELLRRGY